MREDTLEQLEAFASGYLTAYNTFVAPNGDAVRGRNYAGRLEFLDEWCRDNPTEIFAASVRALIAKGGGKITS